MPAAGYCCAKASRFGWRRRLLRLFWCSFSTAYRSSIRSNCWKRCGRTPSSKRAAFRGTYTSCGRRWATTLRSRAILKPFQNAVTGSSLPLECRSPKPDKPLPSSPGRRRSSRNTRLPGCWVKSLKDLICPRRWVRKLRQWDRHCQESQCERGDVFFSSPQWLSCWSPVLLPRSSISNASVSRRHQHPTPRARCWEWRTTARRMTAQHGLRMAVVSPSRAIATGSWRSIWWTRMDRMWDDWPIISRTTMVQSGPPMGARCCSIASETATRRFM